MVAVNHSSSVYTNSDYSQYAIDSWKSWCEKNDVDFKVITEHDDRLGKPVWNKELVYKHAEDYDKIGVVDSDTMIRWDAPNIFDLYEDEFCGVNDNSTTKNIVEYDRTSSIPKPSYVICKFCLYFGSDTHFA